MNTADLHTLTGAYATQALSEPEREEFERHMAECAPCTQEVRELAATAGRLGLAVSVSPPPDMKDRVMRSVAAVRQEPPRMSRRRTRGGARHKRSLSRFTLAACVAAAAGLGGVAVWQYQAAQDARLSAERADRREQDLIRVLAAPDARATTGKLKDGSSATVVVSHRQDKAAFFTAGLPSLPDGKVYQLWFADGGTMRSAGLVGSSAAPGGVLMDGSVGRASGVGITVEPAGGSKRPTTDPLALMNVAPAQGA
ncbi:anti-sigma factor [Streptomyces sp. 8N706]|uniref:anti-sigma factor n=1 Tax=Streptomyces sp. 8N706 TaxID=3457416 RepID=UPI003FD27042